MTRIVPGSLASYNLLGGQRDLPVRRLAWWRRPFDFHSLKITVLGYRGQKSFVSLFFCLFPFILNTQR